MVGDGGAEVPGLEPSSSSSPRGVQALLPGPAQIQGWWVVLGQGPGCWKGPEQAAASAETHPASLWTPASVKGRGSSNGGRRARAAEGHTLGTQAAGPTLPQSRQLSPPHSCPKPHGCPPTGRLGSEWPTEEPRKSKRRQLLNHGSPFIAQPRRAQPPPPARGAETQPPAPGLSPTQPAGAQGRGDGALSAGGSPTVSPLCSPRRPCHRGQGRARARS